MALPGMSFEGDFEGLEAVKALRAELAVFKENLKETAASFKILGNGLKNVKEVTKTIKAPMAKLAQSFKMMKVPQGMQALFTGMPKLSAAMSTFLTPLTKKMGGNKFKKGVKAMTGLVGGIMKSSASAWAMAKLMQLMEPFLSLLELFNPIFEVLAAIFQEALMPVIIELLPYIMMATTWLMENKAAIIQVINVLMPLLLIFHLLKGNTEELQIIMVPLSIIIQQVQTDWEKLMVILGMVYTYLSETFGPAWNWLLTNALEPIYDFLEDYLFGTFEDLEDIFEDLEEFADNAAEAIETLVGWIDDIELPSWMGGGGKSGGGGDGGNSGWDPIGDFGDWSGLYADGGITQGPTKGTIGEAGAEALIPLERSNPFTDAIEEMAYAQNKTLIVLEEIRDGQYKAKGLNRRRFG